MICGFADGEMVGTFEEILLDYPLVNRWLAEGGLVGFEVAWALCWI